jgi:hypothetical protein
VEEKGMTEKDLPILGISEDGKLVLGGFFTAHDTHGLHTDWFLSMFLAGGFNISIPYFACECLQHPSNDPDMIWPMLEIAYREARQPFNVEEQKAKLSSYLAFRWTQMGKPSLRDMSLKLMAEQRENGKAFWGFAKEVGRALSVSFPTSQ